METLTYNKLPDTNDTPLKEETVPPALVVWLFLVVYHDFITQLETANYFKSLDNLVFKDANANTKSLAEISKATNLSTDSIKAIFQKAYLDADTDTQKSFRTVADSFQNLARISADDSGWQGGRCPGVNGIINLALKGATLA